MAVDEKRYRKTRTKGKPIVFFERERWVQMKDLSDGTYYISDFGRVARLNPQGIFHELKKTYFCKAYYVSIEIDENDGVHTRKRVSGLVLKYFVGGANKMRRIEHLNGDKEDCRLSNLRWRKGFIDKVDLDYLNRVNTSKMSEESTIVTEFLKTDDCSKIFELLYSYNPLIRYMDFRMNTKYIKNNDIETFYITVIDKIKAGEFKPNVKHREIITFKTFLMNSFREVAYRYKSMREFAAKSHWIVDNFAAQDFSEVEEHLKYAV